MKDIDFSITKKAAAPPTEQAIVSEEITACPNCDIPLFQVVLVEETDRENKLQAICPECKEESYVYKITGEIFLAPAPGMMIVDIKEDRNTIIEVDYA